MVKGRIKLDEQERKTDSNVQENTIKQKGETCDSQLSQTVKKHGEKISFFASIFTIVGSLVSSLTLTVTFFTLKTATSINNAVNTTINNNQTIQVGDIGIIQYSDTSTLTVSIENSVYRLKYLNWLDQLFG